MSKLKGRKVENCKRIKDKMEGSQWERIICKRLGRGNLWVRIIWIQKSKLQLI